MIVPFTVKDVFETNCYFVLDENSRHVILIDAGAEAQRIISIIKNNNLVLEGIILTHAHMDHCAAVDEIVDEFKVPVYAHFNESLRLNPNFNLSYIKNPFALENVIQVKEGDEISFKSNPKLKLKITELPGHTPDSIGIYYEHEKSLFVGDTMFLNQMGLTHFPLGNKQQLLLSIKKILKYPKDTKIFSGHTEATSVKHESLNYDF